MEPRRSAAAPLTRGRGPSHASSSYDKDEDARAKLRAPSPHCDTGLQPVRAAPNVDRSRQPIHFMFLLLLPAFVFSWFHFLPENKKGPAGSRCGTPPAMWFVAADRKPNSVSGIGVTRWR